MASVPPRGHALPISPAAESPANVAARPPRSVPRPAAPRPVARRAVVARRVAGPRAAIRPIVIGALGATTAATVGLVGVGISSSSASDRHTLAAAAAAANAAARQQREASTTVAALAATRAEVLASRETQREDLRARVLAAKHAAARKAAKKAAAAKRAKALAAAQRNPKAAAKALLDSYGFGADQWSCLSRLWAGESNWNYRAANTASGAYGIPQALPGAKMGTLAPDWKTNPTTQIRWGLGYIKDVYGTPCGAWNLWISRYPHWY